ncbi:MAG TPA: rhomboid family intramembrane serine protease [Verrucomicrobiae bacterium]|nr:rhomboid family intramembrane serine protease [Verrucomicrobiae bacterium]
MPTCPICQTPLKTHRQREGLFYQCPGCGGRAVTIPQLRRVAGDRFATGLLRQINTQTTDGIHPCPFCSRAMRMFHSSAPPLELDACKPCGVVWFDPHEFEIVPEGAVASVNELQLRGAEAFGLHRVEQMKRWNGDSDPPEETWKWVPAFFGFPIESDVDSLRSWPWFTWSLALLISLFSVHAFFNLEAVVRTFGFIPAEAWRYGGLTFLTSFFLHGGVLHLLGNLYFLLIFGDNVEDFLGKLRYGLLVLTATLAGDLLHLLAAWGSTTPCIGASGGIAGIIVFYALKFPQARLGFLFRYFVYLRWLQIPAWGALVLWLLLQCVGIYTQLNGFSNVAATAHLGGATIGFLLWLLWRKADPTEGAGI